ncbi:hypothetical protein ACGF0D_25035 [Kitasatospora sp. NPDC048298]|uniref:hypothetical protein n=1 Tax=Kitasatospora sp. NPDC048298 TaxID=3364049 RepID=UPI003722DC8F
MSDVTGRSAMFCAVLVGVLCAVSACTGASGGDRPTVAGGAASTAATGHVFPESFRKLILRTAKADGTAPAGDRFTVIEYDGGYDPELIWQAEKTGDLCVASESITAGRCRTEKQIAEKRVPGVDLFGDSGLFNRQEDPWWAVSVMASGETIDHLSCQGRNFPVRQVYSVTMGGAQRTVYTAAIPRNLQGEYRVAVQRDGQSEEERLDLGLEKGYAVHC